MRLTPRPHTQRVEADQRASLIQYNLDAVDAAINAVNEALATGGGHGGGLYTGLCRGLGGKVGGLHFPAGMDWRDLDPMILPPHPLPCRHGLA